MIFDALVWGYVRRSGLRAATTLFAIALAVAIALALDVAGATAAASLASSVDTVAERVDLQIAANGASLDERLLPRIGRLSGIEDARPLTSDELDIGTLHLQVRGVDTLAGLPHGVDPRAVLPGPFVRTGSDPQPGTLVRGNAAFISARVAAAMAVRVGSTFAGSAAGRRVQLRVAGILKRVAGDVDANVAFVDIATAQRAFAKRGRLDRIDCVVVPGQNDRVRAALVAVLPSGVTVVATATRAREIVAFLGIFRAALALFALYALGVGAGTIANALSISVAQRRAEIGALRTIGVTRAQIFRTFVAEGALFGGIGSLAGLGLGMLLANALVPHLLTRVDGVSFEFAQALRAFALGTTLSLLAALAPAFDAARIAPAAAMQSRGYERRLGRAPSALAAAGCVLLVAALALPAVPGAIACTLASGALIPFAIESLATFPRRARRALPTAATLAVRHMGASPRRTFVAIASLGFAFATAAAVATIADSFHASAVTWATRTVPRDIVLSGALSAQTMRWVRAVPGVTDVQLGSDTLALTLAPSVDPAALRARFERHLAPQHVTVRITRDVRGALLARIDGTFAAAGALALIALLVALCNVGVTLFATVLERRTEIQLLRYLGLSARAVRTMVLCEAMFVGALAATLGLALGVGLAIRLVGATDTRAFGWPVQIRVPGATLAELFAGALVCAALAGWYPANAAARAALASVARR